MKLNEADEPLSGTTPDDWVTLAVKRIAPAVVVTLRRRPVVASEAVKPTVPAVVVTARERLGVAALAVSAAVAAVVASVFCGLLQFRVAPEQVSENVAGLVMAMTRDRATRAVPTVRLAVAGVVVT